jgi:hypothetical protein
MALFPFISRQSHQAIVDGKDEQINLLQLQLGYLKELEARSIARADETETKVLNLVQRSMRQPEPVQRRKREPSESEPPAPAVDLAMVDPNDNETLAHIVRSQIPAGMKTNGSAMLRSVEHLRKQCIEAHEARMERMKTPVYVPAGVAAMIESAEQDGIKAAEAMSNG